MLASRSSTDAVETVTAPYADTAGKAPQPIQATTS